MAVALDFRPSKTESPTTFRSRPEMPWARSGLPVPGAAPSSLWSVRSAALGAARR